MKPISQSVEIRPYLKRPKFMKGAPTGRPFPIWVGEQIMPALQKVSSMEPVNTGSHLGSLAQIGSRFERECSQACGGLGIGRPGSQVQEDNFPFALGGSFQAESLAMPGCPNPIDF